MGVSTVFSTLFFVLSCHLAFIALFNQLNYFSSVPDDVFAPDFVWKGSYDYKGQKQPMTLTVSSFNATSGKVNVTLADSSVEFLLSGESSINHLSAASSPLLLSIPPCHFYLFWRLPHVNHRMISCVTEKLNIGSKEGCISLQWLLVWLTVRLGLIELRTCFLICSHLCDYSSLLISFPSAPFSLPHARAASSLHICFLSSTLKGCTSARRRG